MKKLFAKEYLKWLFFKIISMAFIIVSIYYFININNLMLGTVYFILSFVAYLLHNRIKPTPKLATCLEDSGMFMNIITYLSLTTSLAILLQLFFFSTDETFITLVKLYSILIFLLSVGVISYIYNCKKNQVII